MAFPSPRSERGRANEKPGSSKRQRHRPRLAGPDGPPGADREDEQPDTDTLGNAGEQAQMTRATAQICTPIGAVRKMVDNTRSLRLGSYQSNGGADDEYRSDIHQR